MITISNLNNKWDEIRGRLNPETVEMGVENGFLEAAQEYEELKDFFDDEAKELLNKFIARVNRELKSEDKSSKTEPKANPKSAKKTKSEPQSVKSEPKSKSKVKKEPVEKTYVDSVPADVAILKRAASLHGKKATQKVMAQALSILKALQRAIEEKKITKTSQYADEIVSLQDSLIRLLQDKRVNHNTTIEMKSIELMKKLKKEVVVSDYVKLAKKFIS